MTFSINHLGNNGHLGNQMFQYAFVKAMAKKYNTDFCIPPNEIFGKYYYQKLLVILMRLLILIVVGK